MARAHPEQISPTAHYTGYVWFANGYSNEAFATREGRLMWNALRIPNLIATRAHLPSLDGMLLARHRLIDLRLAQAIDAGEISQVVEVACGLSPRGWRFHHRYGDRITYIEADLPGMLANKQRILGRLGGETSTHYTRPIDALSETGIAELLATLDPGRGTAIITEGLVNYFDRATVTAMWSRFAAALSQFPKGIYYSDIIVEEANHGAMVAAFTLLLNTFVRGRTHIHFPDAIAVEAALDRAGFDGIVLDPRDFTDELPDLELAGAGRVKIIEALARQA